MTVHVACDEKRAPFYLRSVFLFTIITANVFIAAATFRARPQSLQRWHARVCAARIRLEAALVLLDLALALLFDRVDEAGVRGGAPVERLLELSTIGLPAVGFRIDANLVRVDLVGAVDRHLLQRVLHYWQGDSVVVRSSTRPRASSRAPPEAVFHNTTDFRNQNHQIIINRL